MFVIICYARKGGPMPLNVLYWITLSPVIVNLGCLDARSHCERQYLKGERV